MSDLSAEQAVQIGGWARDYAVVPAIATDGDVAVALIAGNGLGYEMEVEVFIRDGVSWRSTCSWGFGNNDYGLASGSGPGYACAVGRLRPPERTALVAFGDEVVQVLAGDDGYWAWIKAVKEPWRYGEPEVVPE